MRSLNFAWSSRRALIGVVDEDAARADGVVLQLEDPEIIDGLLRLVDGHGVQRRDLAVGEQTWGRR